MDHTMKTNQILATSGKSLPPENIDPSDLWALFFQQERAHKVIESPLILPDGTRALMVIQVLTADEHTRATAEAENYTKRYLKNKDNTLNKDEVNEAYKTLYNNRAMVEVLFRACRKAVPVVDLSQSFFPSHEAMTKKLTVDQLGVLFNNYLLVQQELGPIVSQMEQYELDAWIEKLAKGGSCYPLGSLTPVGQSQLILYMANLSWMYLMDNTSVLSQPEGKQNEEHLPETVQEMEIVAE